MYKRIVVLCFLNIIFTSSLCFGQDIERWFWPLGDLPGEVIMRPGYVENPVHKNIFLNQDYFIAGQAGQPVYAPCDGLIIDVSPFEILYPNYYESWSFDSLESFLERKKESTDPFLNESNLTSGLGIEALDGSFRVWIAGFSSLNVTKGQRVSKGELLGSMGYIRTFSYQPCIQIGLSASKPLLGLYLLGEDDRAMYASLPKPVPFDPQKVIKANQLTVAWEIFSQAVLEDHPAMLDSSLKQEFLNAILGFRPDEDSELNAYEFALLLKKAVAALHCTHTKILFDKTSDSLPVPPLDLVLHGGEVFVLWDKRATKTIEPGSKVTAINGKSIAEIETELGSMISEDARSDDVRLEVVENYFDIMLPLLFEYPDKWQYDVVSSTGAVEQQLIPCLSLEELVSETVLAEWQKSETATFRILDDSTAVLRLWSINQAMDQDTVAGWFKELQERSISNLILDLRDNYGGEPENAALLFSNFAKKPFTDLAYSEILHAGQYNSMKHSLNMSYRETESYPGIFADYQDASDGRYIKYSDTSYQPVSDYGFSGKVFVLVDSGTASAAVWLARALAEHGAYTIGTETGGGFYSANALKFNRIKLGETGLQLRMPLFRTVFAQGGKMDNPQHRGLIPAYQRSRTLEDKLYGTDSVMEFTLDLIANPPEPESIFKAWSGTMFLFAGIGLFVLIALGAFILLAKKRRPGNSTARSSP